MKLNRRFFLATTVCSLGLGLPARADDKEPAAKETKPEEKADAKKESAEVGDFTFHFGAPWIKGTPRNNMIAANLTYGDPKDALVVDFYFFGAGQGGSAKANVDRWIGQFEGEPKVETKTVDHKGTKVTYVYATGTFLSGTPVGPKTPMKDHALHGAIVEGDTAPVFIKMTGPAKGMTAAREAFEKLAASPFGE